MDPNIIYCLQGALELNNMKAGQVETVRLHNALFCLQINPLLNSVTHTFH
jgi:hypothetical protein